MTPRRLPALVLLTMLATGCGPSVLLPAEDGPGTSGGSVGDGPGAVTGATPPPATSTTSAITTTTATTTGQGAGDGSSSDTGASFFKEPEIGGPCFKCDIFAQKCPEGEKCMPWANDGGPYWNSTRCTPIDDDPGAPGEPCTVEGNAVTGIDSCQLEAMCWDVDPQTNEGTCIAMCTGNMSNPQCPSSTSCLIDADSVLAVCLPTCDPLADECGASERCEPTTDAFGCYPGTETSPAAGPCDFFGICDVGLTCVDAEVVAPSCDPASPGCCTPWCDLSAHDPSAGCFDPAQQCVPWWGEEPAPAGLEHVGVCAVMDL